MNPAAVAVAVVSWNTRELLDRCLESLRADADAERGAGLAEVWVIDNASSDGSAELVRERHAWATLVEAGANLGYGSAANLVAARTRAPWLAVANADVALAPGALAALLAAGERDPRAGALAPRLIAPDGSTQHTVHAFPTLANALAFNLGLWRLVPGAGERLCLHGQWDPARPRAVDWAHGALLLLRRAAWDEVGGFDAAQWLYAEDLDLCWRLRRAGWNTRYEPGARARHEIAAAARSADWGAARELRAQAAAYAWMRRRFGRAQATACALVNFLGALGRWAPLALAARIAPRRFAARRDASRAWTHMHATGLRAPVPRHAGPA